MDAYTLHVLSDRFRWHPRNLVSPNVWLEARATRRMLTGLERQGVAVRFGSPAGPFFRRLPVRNHRKLVTIDGQVAYFGGLNFSDHNFGWHDLMLRVEDAHVAAFLEEDFLSTWAGRELRSLAPCASPGLRCLGDMERATRLDPGFVDPQLPMAASATASWRSATSTERGCSPGLRRMRVRTPKQRR